MDIFTNKILPLFDRSGKSDMELEREIGLPRSIIYDWRNGRSKSYKKYLVEISNYFGVSVESIAGNEQKNKLPAEARSLSDIENEILSIFHTLPEDKKQAFITVARSLKSQSKDK
ncbi:hypothetical protein [Caproiciproducens galactitolivorans]|jgi:repressor LexA|uniref:hypothetical protein n=1 Tax=Caproiciproducens galactitolivorans TaxID=642589 RepID=UPI00240976DE|nr:hypothetical protein [Caproiciproducens galactitolivorans]